MDKTAQALQLRDIHLPHTSLWPLAPGWWILLILALVGLFFLIKKIRKIQKLKALNKLMQNELASIREAYNQHKNKQQFAADAAQLLKRFVRHIVTDSRATALTGKAWINYLHNLSKGDDFKQHAQTLTHGQYQKNSNFDVSKLTASLKNFFPKAIKNVAKHKRGTKNA